jgi:small subunit ribosomal protein S16
MVKLRLRRKGRTHYPVYDIIAVDSRKKRDGDFLERLGYYDPHSQPSTISVDPTRAIYWLNVGAQPTDLVRELLSYEGVLLRRTLEFKGKTAEEIENEIEKHKVVAHDRYFRRLELRKKREEAKIKAKADAEAAAAAEAAKPAEAPAVAEA